MSLLTLTAVGTLKPFTPEELAARPRAAPLFVREVRVNVIDPRSETALVGATQVAKQILRALVQDLELRPGDFVYEASLRIAFTVRGLSVDNLRAGLEYAQQHGWLILNPELRVYTLTQAGCAIL